MEQLKHKIICDDCLNALQSIEDKSIDAIVTDPPYGVSFMGKAWDKAVPYVEVWRECLRVLKSGAFMFCMSLPRQDVLSRMIVNIEDAGFNVAFPSIYHTFACVSEDTEVFTQHGWKRWDQLQKNIYMYKILIYDYEKDKYCFEKPKWSTYRIRDTCIRIKSDLTDQIVTRNHRVFVEREGKLLCVTAERLSTKETIPVVEKLFDMQYPRFSWAWFRWAFSYCVFKRMWQQSYFKSKQRKEAITSNPGSLEMLYMRQGNRKTRKRSKTFKTSFLFSFMLWQMAFRKRRSTRATRENWCFRTSRVDRRIMDVISRENEWSKQSSMERRDNIFQNAWQLCKCKICTVSRRVFKYGSQRWVCDGTSLISGSGIRKTLMAIRNGASHRSRSNKQRDRKFNAFPRQSRTQIARRQKSYRTTLADVSKEEYEGIVYCPTVSTGCFVARRKGKVFITGNSGFPKASNISKAVDKQPNRLSTNKFRKVLNNMRKEKKYTLKEVNNHFGFSMTGGGMSGHWFTDNTQPTIPTREQYEELKKWWDLDTSLDNIYFEAEREVIGKDKTWGKEGATPITSYKEWDITISTTPEAKALEGFYAGYAPKPCLEVVIVSMKPIEHSTYVAQALDNGKGGTNLDAGRIPYESEENIGDIHRFTKAYSQGEGHEGWKRKAHDNYTAPIVGNKGGRFAPHLLVEDDVLNDGTIRKSTGGMGEATQKRSEKFGMVHHAFQSGIRDGVGGYGDSGSFSSYFSLDAWFDARIKELPEEVQKTFPFLIVPKASKSEKNKGLKEKQELANCPSGIAYNEHSGIHSEKKKGNTHSTVKPIKLISYLLTIASREGDIILDPYVGSGTTLVSAELLNCNSIGIDISKEYCEIAHARLKGNIKQIRLDRKPSIVEKVNF